MTGQASVDHASSPPRIDIPRAYNATVDLIDVNLAAGRGGKVAVIDDRGRYTYAELAERMARCGNALKALGVGMEQRVALCLLDTVDFPAVFLGAIRPASVPVAAQHAAHHRRLRLHAARQPRARRGRLRRPAARSSNRRWPTSPSSRHVIVAGGEARAIPASTRWSRAGVARARAGADRVRRRRLLALFLRLDRRAQGHGAPASRAWCRRRSSMAEAGPGHPRATTSSTPRRSCSSPTASATPSPSRSASAPPRC